MDLGYVALLNLVSGAVLLAQDGSSDLGLPSLVSLNAKCVVILDNLRSAFNVGSIFRTSECLLGQVASLVLTGYTVRAPVLPLPLTV